MREQDILRCIHLVESALRLVEEVVDDAFAEVALVFIVVHF